MGKYITDYFLYRKRFVLGYTIVGLAAIMLLFVAALYVPGGLSSSEIRTSVTSNALSLDSFNPESIVNLPYHLMQRLSFTMFGVSELSVKLPSVILGLLSIAGMLILLQAWFKRNVAIITTILVVTTGQFLFISQSGSPNILYVFWSIWLLVAAMMVSRQAVWGSFWKIILFGVAALSLYTPLSIYILLALLSAVLLHPHLRFIVRRLSKPMLAVALLCALVLAAPLIQAVITEPAIGLRLLGIPDEWPSITANLMQLARQYFGFLSPSASAIMTPVYGLGSMLLIALGVYRLVTTKYTARSYIIAAWIILLLPILVINPAFISVTFVPVILLMGMGIGVLLGHWYQMFPQNPYARIAGLIPLAVLIGGMVFSGLDRYLYGYHYDPSTASNFSRDLDLLNEQLNKPDRGKVTIVTAESEAEFYKVIADHNKDVEILVSLPQVPATTTIITRESNAELPAASLNRIVTDTDYRDADRFYIYKTDQK